MRLEGATATGPQSSYVSSAGGAKRLWNPAAIALVGLALLVAIGMVAYAAFARVRPDVASLAKAVVLDASAPGTRSVGENSPTTPSGGSPSGTTDTGIEQPEGFPTPLAALEAYLPVDYSYEVRSETESQVEYATAPPESDYTELVVVAKLPDGSWAVRETHALELDITELAEDLVLRYLEVINADDSGEAEALTVSGDPFLDSTRVQTGEIRKKRILTTIIEDDGSTVRVNTVEAWSSENWVGFSWGVALMRAYTCVPTPAGYRILRSETLLTGDWGDYFD